jgi:hypothetical protein
MKDSMPLVEQGVNLTVLIFLVLLISSISECAAPLFLMTIVAIENHQAFDWLPFQAYAQMLGTYLTIY